MTATRSPQAAPSLASCRAPAKVNVLLRVLGTRADGYHLVESLMIPISLYDDLELVVGRGPRRVRCSVAGPEKVAAGRANLAAVAAARVLSATEADVDVDVRIFKRIPCGAGLGGGSSDAAAVLRLLPRMLGRRLSRSCLHRIATQLGADVPFFLRCRPSWATGIGERLTAFDEIASMHLCVAVPPARVSTAWAYANALPARAHRRLPDAWRASPDAHRLRLGAKSLSCLFFNDFERGVRAACEDVGRLLATMKRLGAVATVMSGSGSAVVGAFACEREAREAAAALGSPGSADLGFAVRVLRRPPALRARDA